MEIVHNEKMSYIDIKKAQYPGYLPRGARKAQNDVTKAKEEMERRKEVFDNLRKTRGNCSETIAAQGLYEESFERYNSLYKALTTGSVFTSESVEDCPYIPAEVGFSFGDYVTRQVINANRSRVPMDHYVNNEKAQIVPEGGNAELNDLNTALTVISTDSDDVVIFDDPQIIGENVYNDDPQVVTAAFDSAHNRRMVNGENAKALEILSASKAAIAVSAVNVQGVINDNLCGKAKKNAIIITNKTGFAALDIDVNGIPLVTRDQSDRMIYKHKYIIQEIPDEILPNTDAGAPILVGDWAHVLKFYIIREDSLFKDDIFPFNVGDRKVRKEIITLTTTSDEAYIVGYITA